MSDSAMVGQRDSVFERDDVEPLLSGYRPLPGIFDEMVDRDGRVRAHWQPLLAMLAGLGPKELSRRFAAADRHLRDSGVFYRVYEDAAGVERPWPLSHVPLLIDGAEWQALKAGLVQRARGGARRCLWSGQSRARGPTAGGRYSGQSGIPAAAGRGRAGRRRASAVLCRRRRALARWPLVGARRSRASALGRRLCAREPPRAVAGHARGLSGAEGRAAGAILPGVSGRAFRAQSAG